MGQNTGMEVTGSGLGWFSMWKSRVFAVLVSGADTHQVCAVDRPMRGVPPPLNQYSKGECLLLLVACVGLGAPSTAAL